VFGSSVVALSLVVGAFMFFASLHEYVGLLSFTPGVGYATMFSVHAAEATSFGVTGLAGETLAAVASMFLGAAMGLTTEIASTSMSDWAFEWQ